MLPVVQLKPDDADRYVLLRREMLQDSPWAFGASLESDRGSDPAQVRASLAREGYGIFAAVDGEQVVGVAGVRREEVTKRRHIAYIWGVYVTPSHRRQGLSRAVVRAAIEAARRWPDIEVIHLSVSEASPHALRVYESLGFAVWGVEPDCLRVGGRGYTEHHLHLRVR